MLTMGLIKKYIALQRFPPENYIFLYIKKLNYARIRNTKENFSSSELDKSGGGNDDGYTHTNRCTG